MMTAGSAVLEKELRIDATFEYRNGGTQQLSEGYSNPALHGGALN